jgi:hypothetical protein
LKVQILTYSFYVGIYKALWYGYTDMVSALCEQLIKVALDSDHELKQFADELDY